ncbi:zinc metalloprotease HtpX, partial [Patescibacteria group bacterium]|nr:zinc metalloprotease HtpX [Patescibacteria group bacterium]
TRHPEGLASALEKIQNYDGELKKANHATAHLYISSPFGSKKGKSLKWYKRMFDTHPPTELRIKKLRNLL